MGKIEVPSPRLSFDEAWAITENILRDIEEMKKENARQKEEYERRQEEYERRREEEARQRKEENDRRHEENERRHEEFTRDMQRIHKKLSKDLGHLGNRYGDLVESLVTPNLLKKFEALGFTFNNIHRHSKIGNKEHNIFTEVDALLENGDKVMVVEIKSKPDSSDIKEHIERMEKLRKIADLRSDKRVFLGAIAGAVFNDNEKTFALKTGFYVIEPSGKTFNIIAPEGECSPREW